MKKVNIEKQNRVREMLKNFMKRPTLDNVSKAVGIASATLSNFKHNKDYTISEKNLDKLEKFLIRNIGN